MTIQPFGDRALLINFEQKIDKTIHNEVLLWHQTIQTAQINGVLYNIPAYCSLTIGYNPMILTYKALVQKIKALKNTLSAAATTSPLRKFNIPVCYDAPYALDMEAVCQQTGLTKTEIIRLHTTTRFRVYMLGFLPGFVYMGKLPQALFCKRKTTPRLKVPAQAVGVAGFQTGIYPNEAPGGWQIIGQTPIKTFDPIQSQPFLLQAGDEVRFYAISKQEFLELTDNKEALTVDSGHTTIYHQQSAIPHTILYFKRTGLQTTIQDAGRIGQQQFAVPISGPMDQHSARMANWLVGNDANTPVLEITLLGPTIVIEGNCQIAITGSDLSPKINRQPVPMYETLTIQSGSVLAFGSINNGSRAYVAIRGSWQVRAWLGSRSAMLYDGAALTPDSVFQKNSTLRIQTTPRIPKKIYPISKHPTFSNAATIRVMAGPEFEQFSRWAIGYFFSTDFEITPQSNRMGYRLNKPLKNFQPTATMISSGIVPGTIQITQQGHPIVLMRDAQTTGGYARLAVILSTDLDRFAQLKPKDTVRFVLVDFLQ